MKENYNGFPHNRANEDDDKDSHTIYSYFVCFVFLLFNENAYMEIQATTINIFMIFM